MEAVGVPDEEHLPSNKVLQQCALAYIKHTIAQGQTDHGVVDDSVAPVRCADVGPARPERAAREPDLVQDGADVVLGRRGGEVRAADLGHVRNLSTAYTVTPRANG